jgi:hypothetical protein
MPEPLPAKFQRECGPGMAYIQRVCLDGGAGCMVERSSLHIIGFEPAQGYHCHQVRMLPDLRGWVACSWKAGTRATWH